MEYVRLDRATAIQNTLSTCGLRVRYPESSPTGADVDYFGFLMGTKETHGTVLKKASLQESAKRAIHERGKRKYYKEAKQSGS